MSKKSTKNISISLSLSPEQAEAFIHMLDVNCLALEQQVVAVQAAIKARIKGIQTKEVEEEVLNLTNYLDGVVNQHALASTILKAIQEKVLADEAKPDIIAATSIPKGKLI